MTTKGKKQSSSRTATPVPGGSSTTPRPTSPLSPTRHSRLAEKAELQNLNDRLACYIDRSRNLENENARLTVEVHTTRETVTREVSNIKAMYEHELSDARKLLDETAREKAKLEIDTKRLWEENDELKTRLDKALKDLKVAEASARHYESRFTEISSKYNTAIADRKKAQDDVKDLEKEIERLRKLLDETRKNLEIETLARVDLENNIQSLREELIFKDQIHSQELTETRTRRQVEISEIDGRLSQQYEAKLQQSLQELRDQYEGQMRSNREEIELLFENKMKNLENAANRNSNAASGAMDELRTTRTRIDSMNARLSELDLENAQLKGRLRDLEKILNAERSRHNDDISILESELQRMRDEMAQQLQEYQDLMDIKVSLDLEIAAYDKLLKGEEHRLNITPTSGNATTNQTHSFRTARGTSTGRTSLQQRTSTGSNIISSPGGLAALKRKRTIIDEAEDRSSSEYYVTASAKGDIEIIEADADGKFVKLHNKSNKEIQIGGWQLLRSVGNNETSFKLHRSVKIDGNGFVTVWSSDSGITHEPPINIVMKQQKWFTGDNMKTTLLNTDGEEVAASERIKQIVSSHASRYRVGGAGIGEDIYHQQVRGSSSSIPSTTGGDPVETKQCTIM